MSIFDTALHIPAEPAFLGGGRRTHERVLLPLAARPSALFLAAVAIATAVALACLAMALVLAVSGGRGNLAMAPVFVLAAILPAGLAVTGLRDAFATMPLLVIDGDGLRDSRLGAAAIPWATIVEAELVAAASGIVAVRLTLDADGPPRFNPCRIGGWSADWRKRRRVRTIALLLLDQRPHRLAHTILALAARHGARVEPAATIGR